MATAQTASLGPSHPPTEKSLEVFGRIEKDLKKELWHMRHEHDKHEKEYFMAVKGLSNEELVDFSSSDLVAVRIATTAYGLHLFGKLHLPRSSGGYIHFRVFIGDDGNEVKLHSIHTLESEDADGDKHFRGIFREDEELLWFDE